MAIDVTAYKHAAYPPSPWLHLSDEDIAEQLDKSEKRSKAARKRQETIRQKNAVQASEQEKQAID